MAKDSAFSSIMHPERNYPTRRGITRMFNGTRNIRKYTEYKIIKPLIHQRPPRTPKLIVVLVNVMYYVFFNRTSCDVLAVGVFYYRGECRTFGGEEVGKLCFKRVS